MTAKKTWYRVVLPDLKDDESYCASLMDVELGTFVKDFKTKVSSETGIPSATINVCKSDGAGLKLFEDDDAIEDVLQNEYGTTKANAVLVRKRPRIGGGGRDAALKRLENKVDSVKTLLVENSYNLFDAWDDSSRGETTPSARDNLRANLANAVGSITCQVTGYSVTSGDAVRGAHIWPTRWSTNLPINIKVNNPKNGLLLASAIETAFDKKEVCFLCTTTGDGLVFRVLNPRILRNSIAPGMGTFGDFDGRPLDITKHRPSFTLLSMHARMSLLTASKSEWLSKDDLARLHEVANFLSPEKKSFIESWVATDAQLVRRDPDEESLGSGEGRGWSAPDPEGSAAGYKRTRSQQEQRASRFASSVPSDINRTVQLSKPSELPKGKE